MPRLIVKFPYIKGKSRRARAHLKNYVKYISLRENAERIQQKENYLTYIASRPRAERVGEHALFSGMDEPISLSQVAEMVANHPGNVWTPIISLQREDAERLGYDNAQAWKNLLSAYALEMAQHMKIPLEQFRWYAAFHDEGHHPHVHMVCFSADGKSGFLTKDGLAKIKSGLAKEIFRQELTEIYSHQTQQRNDLTEKSEDALKQLIHEMQIGSLENKQVGELLLQLAEKLQHTSGKKQYGYLKAPVKALVDEIVDELAKDPRIAKGYDLWYKLREDVLYTYRDEMLERIPLSGQKEFKRIKNLVIQEAMQLGDFAGYFSPEDETESIDELPLEENPLPENGLPDIETPQVSWSDRYKMAKEFLYGNGDTPPDFEKAFALFLKEAGAGNALAMYDLGRMFADGLGREIDMEQAQSWYKRTLRAFLEVEPTPYIEYRIGKMYAAGLGTEQDYAQAASWFREAAEQNNQYAMYSLAGLYLKGQGVEMDTEKARELYSKSAQKGFPYAAYELGKLYRDGIGGDKDSAVTEQYFSQAFIGFRAMERESHEDKLQYRIGWMLFHGVGTGKDEAAARDWFEKSARLGNPQAQYRLAKIILADPNADVEEKETAKNWLIKSAEAGNEYAQYALGVLLLDQGDTEAALRWLNASAEQKNQFAQYRLGKLLLQGELTPKNIPRAIHWLTESAEQGNQFAQYRLGKLLLQGEVVPKDIPKAIHWLTTSAEQNNQFAQYTLGKLFLLGKDVERDREMAVYWLTLSAQQGNPYAQYFLLHLDDFRNHLLAQGTTSLLRHLGNIFQEQLPPSPQGIQVRVDSKLKRKIQKKKAAQGHKQDDHEPRIGG